ncbi:MAG: PASTA domain-containing protein [Spiroplasma sp.]|nr:PASTA domain-containing protein [Mycoplasmatales bacterium]
MSKNKTKKRTKNLTKVQREKNLQKNTKVIGYSLLVLFFALFLIIFLSVVRLQITNEYDGVNLNEYAESVYESTEIVKSTRGDITDRNGNSLAVNINLYDMFAIISPLSDTDHDYVSETEETLDQLIEILELDEKAIELFESQLNADDLYQVEFGQYAKGLTVVEKEEIEALEMPGIKFTEKSVRYYPYGDFASYALGYVVEENEVMVGKTGTELTLNPYLRGIDGKQVIAKDKNGIPLDQGEIVTTKQQTNGTDVELTIDSQIQTYVQEAMRKNYEGKTAEKSFIIVMDAKTGEILAMHADPSYDPNIRDIKEHINPFTGYCFEPGSTIKTFVLATAMEENVWDPEKASQTGKRVEEKWGEDEYVADWLYNQKKVSWGLLSWNKGFYFSANTIMTYILDEIGNNTWYEYMTKTFLFGESVESEFLKTPSCEFDPTWELEYANTSFGQGMTINAYQLLRAYSVFGNDGEMVFPHLIKSVTDNEDGTEVYSNTNDAALQKKQTVSPETATSILEELEQVVYYEDPTKAYHTGTNSFLKEGEVLVGGKTGSAEISLDGEYSSGVISSNIVLAPIDDPQIIVYSVVVNPLPANDIKYLSTAISEIIDKSINYLNRKTEMVEIDFKNENRLRIQDYEGQSIIEAKEGLIEDNIKYYLIGSGDVVSQYPKSNYVISSNETVVLKGDEGTMDYENLVGLSYNETYNICKAMNWDCILSGAGHVADIIKVSEVRYEIKLEVPFNKK